MMRLFARALLAVAAAIFWAVPASAMDTNRLDQLINAVGHKIERMPGKSVWTFTVEEHGVRVIADPKNDRMRILVGIGRLRSDPVKNEALFKRLLQANFDSTLDARYAVAKGVLWAAYIHPLAPMTDDQFLSGLGQTVNLARNFGESFSSGALTFGGGDSPGIIVDELIQKLLRQGKKI